MQRNAVHLDTVKQHAVGYPHTIANDTLNADGDVGANSAVLAYLSCWVHDVVAHKAAALCKLRGVMLPHAAEMEPKSCKDSMFGQFYATAEGLRCLLPLQHRPSLQAQLWSLAPYKVAGEGTMSLTLLRQSPYPARIDSSALMRAFSYSCPETEGMPGLGFMRSRASPRRTIYCICSM